ncbi:MAG: hypothetical protein JWP08_406 [Bryobacterales bacterium]|nr:hypothetical protein [Bryobacterales bacterium]
MNNRDHDSAWPHSVLHGVKEVPLKVVAHQREIPTPLLNCEFRFSQIRNARIHLDPELIRLQPQSRNRGLGAVYRRSGPSARGQPECVASRAACKIDGPPWSQMLSSLNHQRSRSRFEISRLFSRTIPLVPFRNLHALPNFP